MGPLVYDPHKRKSKLNGCIGVSAGEEVGQKPG